MPVEDLLTRAKNATLGSVGRTPRDRLLTTLDAKLAAPRREVPGPRALSKTENATLARGGSIFLPDPGSSRIRVATARPPMPRASFGSAGTFLSVVSKRDVSGRLIVRYDLKKLAHLDTASLRVFRWDADLRRYEMIPGTEHDPERPQISVHLSQPGTYALFGLPRDPTRLATVRIACALRGQAGALTKPGRAALKKRVCSLILCEGRVAPPRAGRAKGPCVECLGIPDDAFFDLPECQILQEPPCPCVSAWENVGPFEIQGTGAANRGIGCAKNVLVDPTAPRRVYALAEHGGVWVLDQKDAWPDVRWRPIGDTLEGLQMRAMAVAPSHGRRLYVANSLGLVYTSTRRGASWTRTSERAFGFIRRIVVHPTRPREVLLAANSGLFRSTTGGEAWDDILATAPFVERDILDLAADPADPRILYVGVRGRGVFKSTDGGTTWPNAPILDFALASDATHQMIRIALGVRRADGRPQTDADRTVAVKFGGDVFVSADGGRSFGGRAVLPIVQDQQRRSDGGRFDGEWCNALGVDPNDPSVIIAGHALLFKTTDGGASWRCIARVNNPPPAPFADPGRVTHEDFHDVAFDPDERGVAYIASDGGVYICRDGRADDPTAGDPDTEVFLERNLGFCATEFFRVAVRGETAVGNVDHNGLKGTTDLRSGIWRRANASGGVNALEFHYIHPDPKRVDRYYAIRIGNAGVRMFRLRFPSVEAPNDFLTYGAFTPFLTSLDVGGPTPIARFAALPVSTVAVDERPGSNAILACVHREAGHGFGLVMTTEGDTEPTIVGGAVTGEPTWDLAIDTGVDPTVSVLFPSPTSGRVFAMTQAGRVLTKADVTAGDVDEGWASPGTWPQADVRQLVARRNARHLYAVSGTSFGRSRDGGATWADAATDPTMERPIGGELNSIALHPTRPRTIFLGADTGVLVSHDEGTTWSPFDDGLANADVVQVLVDSGFLYAVTHGRGLWQRRLC